MSQIAFDMDTFPPIPDTVSNYHEDTRPERPRATIESYYAVSSDCWRDDIIDRAQRVFAGLGHDTPKNWERSAGVTFHNTTRFFNEDDLWKILQDMRDSAQVKILLIREDHLESFDSAHPSLEQPATLISEPKNPTQ